LKNILQLASQRTATDRRLLVGPGRLWAMRAFGGSLLSRRSTALGCFHFVTTWLDDGDGFKAGGRGGCVDGVTRDLEAAVLIKAVEDKLGGLVQLE
jgi:hypothetical protein